MRPCARSSGCTSCRTRARAGPGGRCSRRSSDAARELGYECARLDSGPEQRHSRVLFADAGYVEIAQYNANHIADYFAEKRL